MSVRLVANVLDYVHGIPHGAKLVLICMADYADDKGTCWPSFQKLSERCDMSRRHVIRVVADLEEWGLLRKIEERPYKPTIYGLSIPTSDTHVTRSSDTHVTSEADVTSDTDDTTVVTPMSLGSDAHVTTTSDAHVTQTISKNHQRTTKEPSGRARTPEEQLVDAWAERRGFSPTNWAKAIKQAKQLVAAGCAPAEMMEMYDWFEADPFWSDKGFDLGTALSQVDKFRQSKRRPRVAKKTYLEKTMEVMAEVFGESADVDADVFETTGVVR